MNRRVCDHCGIRVVPQPDGTCPSCRHNVEIPSNANVNDIPRGAFKKPVASKAYGDYFVYGVFALFAAMIVLARLGIISGDLVAHNIDKGITFIVGIWMTFFGWFQKVDSCPPRIAALQPLACWIGPLLAIIALVQILAVVTHR